MLSPVPTAASARRRIIVSASAVLLLAISAGLYAVFTHSGGANPPGPGSRGAVVVATGPERAAPGIAAAPMSATGDPEEFARLVAEALFEWDTSVAVNPADLTERLIAVADPTGESSAGLATDIVSYLPAPQGWTQLREYSTRQWIDTQEVEVPTLWPQAVEQAGPDGFLPGTTAYTITGVRHRTGVWEGNPVSTSHDVAFTVFIVCGPSYPQCHLLRLSRLDEPLD